MLDYLIGILEITTSKQVIKSLNRLTPETNTNNGIMSDNQHVREIEAKKVKNRLLLSISVLVCRDKLE